MIHILDVADKKIKWTTIKTEGAIGRVRKLQSDDENFPKMIEIIDLWLQFAKKIKTQAKT